ncbi:hypothetical protein BKE38_13315 [Pseudoroseomonas deserti]|uniref:Cytochrome oxidase subunit II copper A binding domain-containing protein n=1 Tax=Teichococcus deserti TaxID=1817963 RepID=A0A1V2H1K1_9PROT|nr:hypothetical protein [Pseudoroseomonas deserti]ONG53157.1 hypothetical protein BKE38_13315 [Pseudoroseomonas deserti]
MAWLRALLLAALPALAQAQPARDAYDLLARQAAPTAFAAEVTAGARGWRIAYPRPGGPACPLPGPLMLPQGRAAPILLRTEDLSAVHDWRVPGLGLRAAAIPGRVSTIPVPASAPGDFAGEAGAPDVKVIPADDYARWRDTVLRPACPL